jgi:N-carbamoylputrescine amidase
VPVIFSNQSGDTRTTIPMLGTWVMEKIKDRFAGLSSICDGNHGGPVRAGLEEQVVVSSITIHSPRGPKSCHSMYLSDQKVPSFVLGPSGLASPPSGFTVETAADVP